MKTILLTLAVALLIIIPFCLWGEAIDAWFHAMAEADATTHGMLVTLLFSSLAFDIFLPIPSSLASTLCGAFFGWIGGFFISFGAMTLSCIIGWMVGQCFTPLAIRLVGPTEFPRLQTLLQRHGIIILLALRTVPVLAEASVLLAGIAKVPFRKCMPILLIGNAAVSLAYVYAGVYGHDAENMLPAFLASIALSAVLLLIATLLRKRHPQHQD